MRRLVISDLHFGAGDSIAGHPVAFERLIAALQNVDELVINGDLLHLSAGWRPAMDAARPWLHVIGQHVSSVLYLPGNHDYEFAIAGELEARALSEIGEPVSVGELPGTQRMLSALAGVPVRARHPFFTDEYGMTFWHGHQQSAGSELFGVRALDRLRWRRWASGRSVPPSIADREAPRREHQFGWLRARAGAKDASALLDRALIDGTGSLAQGVLVAAGRDLSDRLGLRTRIVPHGAVLATVAAACADMGVPPGVVCVGHTHQAHGPLRAPRDTRWTFHNGGCWTFSDLLLRESGDMSARPGRAMIVQDGHVEHVDLLADLALDQLRAMCADRNP